MSISRILERTTALLWECRYGHRWKAAAEQVKGGLHKKGTWCPKCYDQRRIFRAKGTIEEMRNLALIRGGTCVSDCYSGSREKLLWRCKQGHQWYAVPGRIKRGNWCPVCAGNQKLKLRDYRGLAATYGGKCLSKRYRNNDARLKWRCAKGHEWFATGASVRRGTWCARCAHNRRIGALRRKPGHLQLLCGVFCVELPYVPERSLVFFLPTHRKLASPAGFRPRFCGERGDACKCFKSSYWFA